MTPSDASGRPTEDALVTVTAVRSEIEAQLIVATLADEGIEAVAFPIGAGVLPMATPARPHANLIPIQVHARDADRARAAIDAQRRAATDEDAIDWDEVDVGERVDRVPLATSGQAGRVPLKIRIIALLAIVLLGGSCLIGTVLSLSRGPAGAATDEHVGP